MTGPQAITRLLRDWAAGDPEAEAAVVPRIHSELEALASHHLRSQPPGSSLQTHDLVNEAYLRLVPSLNQEPSDRRAFYSLASKAMRSILVDRSRRNGALRRGGGQQRRRLPLDLVADLFEAGERPDLSELDAALTRLAEAHPDLARVVELRYFGGLTAAQAAETLDTSERTVKRRWSLARAWLERRLGGADTSV